MPFTPLPQVMPFTPVPTTPERRAVQIAAFELAMKRFDLNCPGELRRRHQDAMIAAIIEGAANGTMDVCELAELAIKEAMSLK